MALLLYRIDDRLIHGQVVIGWGQPLRIDWLVLVDDAVREVPWEQELYRSAIPPGMDVEFASTVEASERLGRWQADPRRGILLTGEIAPMVALARENPGLIEAVNLGGLHHKPGRTARLPYVYLTDDEYGILLDLEALGVRVTARDVPTASPVGLEALV